MNSFDSIKLVLFRKRDLEYRIVADITAKSSSMNKILIEFLDDEDLSIKLNQAKNHFRSKEVLILKEFKGRKFQKCPGSSNVICCNYYLLNTCFNCLFNCTYCFLNSYLNSYGIVQFINLEDLKGLIFDHCNSSENVVRIGTGEFTDSIMFDDATSIATELIEATSSIKNLFLEFKTKSSNIDHFKKVKNKGNAVLAWSINTQQCTDLYEEGTASITERLSAARKAQELGFYTAFHFDPIIKYNNYINEYFKVIEAMAENLSPERIVWISLGCFRYSPGFKEIIKRSFPDERLTVAEMFPGCDGKYRYLTPERIEIFSRFREKLKIYFPDVFIYLCMEDDYVWQKVFLKDYKSSEDLETDFSNHLKKNYLKL